RRRCPPHRARSRAPTASRARPRSTPMSSPRAGRADRPPARGGRRGRTLRGVFQRVVGAAGRRPGRVLAVALLLAVAGGLLATRLQPTAATDTLVGRSTA